MSYITPLSSVLLHRSPDAITHAADVDDAATNALYLTALGPGAANKIATDGQRDWFIATNVVQDNPDMVAVLKEFQKHGLNVHLDAPGSANAVGEPPTTMAAQFFYAVTVNNDSEQAQAVHMRELAALVSPKDYIDALDRHCAALQKDDYNATLFGLSNVNIVLVDAMYRALDKAGLADRRCTIGGVMSQAAAQAFAATREQRCERSIVGHYPMSQIKALADEPRFNNPLLDSPVSQPFEAAAKYVGAQRYWHAGHWGGDVAEYRNAIAYACHNSSFDVP